MDFYQVQQAAGQRSISKQGLFQMVLQSTRLVSGPMSNLNRSNGNLSSYAPYTHDWRRQFSSFSALVQDSDD